MRNGSVLAVHNQPAANEVNNIIRLSHNYFIGNGKYRDCFVHPEDASRVIKINREGSYKQTSRELSCYKILAKKSGIITKDHLPPYFGEVDTTLGKGYVYGIVRDYDGQISKSLLWYLQNGSSLDDFYDELLNLRSFLLENRIIFNNDLSAGNLLYQKSSLTSGNLVIIDGLGDHIFIKWLNALDSHKEKKINRRWKRFIKRLKERINNQNEVLN